MGMLGHPIFEPILIRPSANESNLDNYCETIPFYLRTAKTNATGRCTREGFVVLKGSQLSAQPTSSCPESIKRLREKYADRIDQQAILTDNILLSSPSAAASFVTYASTNGVVLWITKDGRSFKEYES